MGNENTLQTILGVVGCRQVSKAGGKMKIINDSPELQYIHRIRNLGKHNYAIEFLYFLKGWRDTEPSYKDYNISYMGGQAVRQELYSLIGK